METRPPTITRILVAIGFALSCFALALFLWITFGGPLPLKPEGYRFTVPFDEATQLAVESDVRISGVPVGKVKAVELADNGRADATIELDSRYAPIPTDTRAMLRTKTLLGETFVELTPGRRAGPDPGGGRQAAGGPGRGVGPARRDLAHLRRPHARRLQGLDAGDGGRRCAAAATTSRPRSPSWAPSRRRRTGCSACWTARASAVRQLVHDGGTVFEALSERQGQLRGLIQNSETVFSTTARRNQELAELFTDPAHLPARVARHPGAPRPLR